MNMDTNKLNKGKTDEIIKIFFFENKHVTGKLEKGGGGNPVPRAPVE
jgi:hypothetical protein